MIFKKLNRLKRKMGIKPFKAGENIWKNEEGKFPKRANHI